MRRYVNRPVFQVTVDQHFEYVIQKCKESPRPGQAGTWITDGMKEAYQSLHSAGLAHSVEVWLENEIVGGLYGVGIGKIFSGESMFSEVSDASKFSVIILDRILSSLRYQFLDCQIYSRHIELLGGYTLDQKSYFDEIRKNLFNPLDRSKWSRKLIPERFRK
jgi:leucyl/phenylalanyl-tRNA--protein transferase